MTPKVPEIKNPEVPQKARRGSLANQAIFRPGGRNSLISGGGMVRKASTIGASLASGAGRAS